MKAICNRATRCSQSGGLEAGGETGGPFGCRLARPGAGCAHLVPEPKGGGT